MSQRKRNVIFFIKTIHRRQFYYYAKQCLSCVFFFFIYCGCMFLPPVRKNSRPLQIVKKSIACTHSARPRIMYVCFPVSRYLHRWKARSFFFFFFWDDKQYCTWSNCAFTWSNWAFKFLSQGSYVSITHSGISRFFFIGVTVRLQCLLMRGSYSVLSDRPTAVLTPISTHDRLCDFGMPCGLDRCDCARLHRIRLNVPHTK